MSSTLYGQTSPTPTLIRPPAADPSSLLDDTERAQALRLKYEASNQLGRIAQQRVRAFRAGDHATGNSLLNMEDELRGRIRDLHMATAPSGLDQSPEQIAGGQASLNQQLPGAQAAVRGQLQNDAAAADANVARVREFFLGPRSAPGESAADTTRRLTPVKQAPGFTGGMNDMGQSVATEQAVATQRSPQIQGLGQVVMGRAASGQQQAQQALDSYNPPDHIDFAPPDEKARNFERANRGIALSNTRRLMGSRAADTEAAGKVAAANRMGTVAEAQAGAAGNEADLQANITKAAIARQQAQGVQAGGLAPEEAMRRTAATNATHEYAVAKAGAKPDSLLSEAEAINDLITGSAGSITGGNPEEYGSTIDRYYHHIIPALHAYQENGATDLAASVAGELLARLPTSAGRQVFGMKTPRVEAKANMLSALREQLEFFVNGKPGTMPSQTAPSQPPAQVTPSPTSMAPTTRYY